MSRFSVVILRDKIKIIRFRYIMSVKKISGFRVFMQEKLGRGSYGAVYKGVSDDTKQECAIKIIDKSNIDSDPYLKAALISEIKIMKTLHSDNIVSFIDVMESTNNYYIVQELCSGDLEGYLKGKPGRCVDEHEAIKLLTEICNGFLTLVKEGIVHRDLKPANIMIANGQMKIGDFGFAKKNVSHGLKNQTSVGTPLYMSVELLKGEPYTSKCDIWAIGFIFYEMLHGCTPWVARSQFELVNNILNKPMKLPKDLHPATINFLQRTLEPFEDKRITWDELFKHEIFQGHFKAYIEENQKLQNVYKKVMGDLRFRINSQNIHLKNLWENLGYDENKELNRKQFGEFLRIIHPEIAPSEEQFFFQKMDINGDGQISLKEVSQEFEKYNIPLASMFGEKLPFVLKKLVSFEEEPEQISSSKNLINSELEKKIQNCFVRLHTILTKKNLTLYKIFTAYDGDKSGELSLPEFSKIMIRLDGSFTEDEMESVFNILDTDQSKTIEFSELNSYYCKVNGVPETLHLPKQFQIEQHQKKNNYHQQKRMHENH